MYIIRKGKGDAYMTTEKALKCIKQYLLALPGSQQEQAVKRIEQVITEIKNIIANYDLSIFDDEKIKEMSFNEIVEEYKNIFDDLVRIKILML